MYNYLRHNKLCLEQLSRTWRPNRARVHRRRAGDLSDPRCRRYERGKQTSDIGVAVNTVCGMSQRAHLTLTDLSDKPVADGSEVLAAIQAGTADPDDYRIRLEQICSSASGSDGPGIPAIEE